MASTTTRGREGRSLLLGTGLGVAVVWVVATLVALPPVRAVDLEVYRTAGAVWRDGLPLYRPGYPHGLGVWLPFTYPPFAAVVLGGLSLLPSPAALALVTVAGLALLGVSTRLALHAAPLTGSPARRTALAAGVLVLAVAVEPVQQTLFFGQVNLVLMGLVALDCLAPRGRVPWPRGLLVGLAAAVKLTPAVFVLVLLCRRQWRAAATAVATFAAAALLGALVLPADSRDYWLGGVLTDPSRVGGGDTAANQSLAGVLARLGVDATPVWLALALLVAALTTAATLGRVCRDDRLGALLTAAAGGLLVSPVSWSHHWVWCVPGLVWLVRRAGANGAHGARSWALTVGFAAVFVVGPYRFFPSGEHRERDWSPWQHLVGDAYAWVALAVVLVGSVAAGRAWLSERRGSASCSPTAPGTPSRP